MSAVANRRGHLPCALRLGGVLLSTIGLYAGVLAQEVLPTAAEELCEQVLAETPPPARRPGHPMIRFEPPPCDTEALPPPTFDSLNALPPVPDRWRIVTTLGYEENLLNPYAGNNILKADRPWFGEWFVNLAVISDSVFESRRLPTPVGTASTEDPGSLDLIGNGDQFFFNQNLIVETVLYKGDTVFRPPDYEFRFIPVLNYSVLDVEERGIIKADPGAGTTRREGFVGIQGLFFDYHIRNVSKRFDFDSLRFGIQPMTTDFRGFLFQDSQFGLRFFGTRDNNIFQYNLAWFRLLEKDANSGLIDITERSFSDSLRDNDVFIANLYWQDFPRPGFTSQATIVHNRDREGDDRFFDDNNFLVRPASLGLETGRDYDVTYLGLNGDGHFDRWNLTYSTYFAFGDETAGTFVDVPSDIRAWFAAAEVSRDFDWFRLRGSFLHGSGDDDPFDDRAGGFDSIFENPQFAGADTSFWIRQAVPLIGGGKVVLSGRNAVLNSLRSGKEFGQSNFSNPGMTLLGIGTDADINPRLRVTANINQLWFDDTATLEVARNQASIDTNIGLDLSLALIYRPLVSQNIVLRLSGAMLVPGRGYEDLYGSETPYSILGNVLLAY